MLPTSVPVRLGKLNARSRRGSVPLAVAGFSCDLEHASGTTCIGVPTSGASGPAGPNPESGSLQCRSDFNVSCGSASGLQPQRGPEEETLSRRIRGPDRNSE
jgi:hypothetical protein